MREANIRIIDQFLPYAYMILISHRFGTTINSLLTDKPHLMDTPDWTLEMVTKYFVIKHESKPRDHGKKQEGHGRQYGKQPDSQPDKQLDQQPEKQQDKQPTKAKCTNCGKFHPGKYHNINISNNLNIISKSNFSNNTKAIELAASNIIGKSFFAKETVELNQNI